MECSNGNYIDLNVLEGFIKIHSGSGTKTITGSGIE